MICTMTEPVELHLIKLMLNAQLNVQCGNAESDSLQTEI